MASKRTDTLGGTKHTSVCGLDTWNFICLNLTFCLKKTWNSLAFAYVVEFVELIFAITTHLTFWEKV